MRDRRFTSRNLFTFLLGIVAVAAIALLAVLIWNSQAAPAPTPPAPASVQLEPTAGVPGTDIRVMGTGWQAGEPVLVYLVETESGATDGVVYAGAAADQDGHISISLPYPQSGLWAGKETVWILARGATSSRQAQALFRLIPVTAEPTSEPETPTAQPTTETPVPAPATETPSPVPVTETPMPTPTSVPPTATPAAVPPTATPKPPAPTATAVRITEWRGEYFDNVNLGGTPKVRNDTRIEFNWGTNGPIKGVKPDNFSVRWTRRLNFDAATYRFYVRVDDGARLWVDGQLLIDRWQDGSTRTYTADRTMTAGKHDIRLEMYERSGQATAAFWREKVDSYPDWKGEYFGNIGLSGSPVLVRNDKGIDFNWGSGAPAAGLPADNFSVRWTRQLSYPAGYYRFYVETDDGVRLWVDGQLIIDQWRDGPVSQTGDLYLNQGQHQVRMEMYERSGLARARMWWAQQDDSTLWRGQYFANRDLAGQPVLVRHDGAINFNWGGGAPAAGLPADNFSVKWTRKMDFAGGTYRFCAQSDDGVSVEMDDSLPYIIREWHDGVGTYCADIHVSGGQHKVTVEYYEHVGNAAIKFWWEKAGSYPQWKGEYFANRKLSGSPAAIRNDADIDFNWGNAAPSAGVPADGFSVRWTRRLQFAAGAYHFVVDVDDGARLWVDGTSVIDQWHDGIGSYTGDIYLTEGQHNVRLEMYENTGTAKARLRWSLESAASGWRGRYYANRNLEGKPVLVRTDATIDFDWGKAAPAPGVPADNFSVKWIAMEDFREGTYRFCARSDDGVSVEMDDSLPYIIREWHDGVGNYCADFQVSGGQHKVTVEYFDHLGDAAIRFWWQRIG
ncbi:MAG: PA14 domain-containing protein [Anaerolineae bacterium]